MLTDVESWREAEQLYPRDANLNDVMQAPSMPTDTGRVGSLPLVCNVKSIPIFQFHALASGEYVVQNVECKIQKQLYPRVAEMNNDMQAPPMMTDAGRVVSLSLMCNVDSIPVIQGIAPAYGECSVQREAFKFQPHESSLLEAPNERPSKFSSSNLLSRCSMPPVAESWREAEHLYPRVAELNEDMQAPSMPTDTGRVGSLPLVCNVESVPVIQNDTPASGECSVQSAACSIQAQIKQLSPRDAKTSNVMQAPSMPTDTGRVDSQPLECNVDSFPAIQCVASASGESNVQSMVEKQLNSRVAELSNVMPESPNKENELTNDELMQAQISCAAVMKIEFDDDLLVALRAEITNLGVDERSEVCKGYRKFL